MFVSFIWTKQLIDSVLMFFFLASLSPSSLLYYYYYYFCYNRILFKNSVKIFSNGQKEDPVIPDIHSKISWLNQKQPNDLPTKCKRPWKNTGNPTTIETIPIINLSCLLYLIHHLDYLINHLLNYFLSIF